MNVLTTEHDVKALQARLQIRDRQVDAMHRISAALFSRTSLDDLLRETLLRSYRPDEWPSWFLAAGVPPPAIHGPVFDSSPTMALSSPAATRMRW